MKKILKVGIIIIIGTFFFFTFLKKKNPEEILSKAIQKTANLNRYHIDYNIETTIKMKGGKIEFSIDQKMDIDNTTKISYIEANISFMDNKLLYKQYIDERFMKKYYQSNDEKWYEDFASPKKLMIELKDYSNLKEIDENKTEYHYQVLLPASSLSLDNLIFYHENNIIFNYKKDFIVDIYIDKKTNYISKIEADIIDGVELINEEIIEYKNLTFVITYSQYNEIHMFSVPYDIILEATKNKYQDLEDMLDF